MQQFCAACSKNGIQTPIKLFQLNFKEATFMCSSEKCMWPFNLEDSIIIEREILPSGNPDWNEIPRRYLKNNKICPDTLDFTFCTPPQTPSSDPNINDVQSSHSTTAPGVMDGITQSILVDCNGETKPVEFKINFSKSFDNFNQSSVYGENEISQVAVKNEFPTFSVKNEFIASNVNNEKSDASQNNIQPVIIKKEPPVIIKNECLSTNFYLKKSNTKNGSILLLKKENPSNNKSKMKSNLRVRRSISSLSTPHIKYNFEFNDIFKRKFNEVKPTKKKEIIKATCCDVNDNKPHQNEIDLLSEDVKVHKNSQNLIVNNSSENEVKDALVQLDAKVNELNESVHDSNKSNTNEINFEELFNADNLNIKNESKEMINLETNCTDSTSNKAINIDNKECHNSINAKVSKLNGNSTETTKMELDELIDSVYTSELQCEIDESDENWLHVLMQEDS
ncbi:putative mediator of RNA polymerase II transcription subunit 29 [Trichogramma pretiosum]|uniref:putative mediator of RNA polymerase II transcription subunit 29 n=1 Tax=Trichogramma pretiosum TaxID=7493 RepID=UPI0006C964A8|nr:putative mediator of RNA polymerase II transcription subunit 29 [Trichogramma pretiosum]